MKRVMLILNPKAGEGGNTMVHLISLLKAEGYECCDLSTQVEKDEKIITRGTDFVVVAGGDGTVRKTALRLLNSRLPIAIIPLGTANNIAKSLGVHGDSRQIVPRWKQGTVAPYDVGIIYNLEQESFFLEALGFGVFPELIQQIKKQKKDQAVPKKKGMGAALSLLHNLALTYPGTTCKIEIDGIWYSGKYLLVEVMNIRSIGPNLILVPFANPGDGEFDVVLIEESQREELLLYIQRKIKGEEAYSFFKVLKAKKIRILWEGTHLHVDDSFITLQNPTEIEIDLQPEGLSFLIGGNNE